MRISPSPVPARAIVHQEGVLALIAVVGLSFRDGGPVAGLAPASAGVAESLIAGTAAGLAISGVLLALRRVPAMAALEAWQRQLVRGWSNADATAVAFISGVAEEALVRALLQPLVGLVPAALLFALLHVVPDRRLWFWPALAFAVGVAFGLLYARLGYPAAAAAHVTLNGISLLRLRR